jgi:enhancing lycopene biosynthesis protein 2
MKKIAVILSGCGYLDGSEIHEATLSLYFIEKYGMEYDVYAPDIDQYHVINHLTREVENGKRNVLVESARIARGKIKNLDLLNAENYDALFLPGGNGAAKNLSDYAFKGAEVKVLKKAESVIKEFSDEGKYICAICIAPVIVAKSLGNKKVQVTIGDDKETAADIESFGARHINKAVTEFNFDEANKVLTTPAYMYNAKITEAAEGIEKLVKKLSEII